MTVEIFSREDFEAALPKHNRTGQPLWEHAGLVQGEHAYHIPVTGTNKRIVVRSSVRANGKSAGTGKDSIRYWVEYYYEKAQKWCSLGKGQRSRYTTREPNWQDRLHQGLQDCWELAVEDSKRHGSYRPERNGSGKAPAPQPPQPPVQTLESAVEVAQAERAAPPTSPTSPADRKALFGAPVEAIVEEEDEPQSESVPTIKRDPNPGQKEAIEAPVHAALRCLAGPGSGKTWTLENRVGYLLDHGVKPENILAVTFSKAMADEMLSRIAGRNPTLRGTAAEKQISTIHACCFRILRSEGDRRNVLDKDWMVKRVLVGDRDLPSILEELWPEADRRPGWKDAYRWINLAKFYGLTTAEDLEFYEGHLGYSLGSKMHQVRRRFDQTLASHQGHPDGGQGITFPDMLLDVEVRLKRDRQFREKWQGYFKWLLIDEGQDTTAQAMRILATLAEPQNQVLIVGDADQLLYRFAGATPEANLYQGFEERYLTGGDEGKGIIAKAKAAAKDLLLGDSGPGTVKLTVNYRSTQAIVEACNRLIAYNYQDLDGPYEEKYRKTLVARDGAPEGQPVHWTWFPDIESESRAIADTIVEHIAQGGKPGDIFIGTRTRAQLGYIEGPLVRAQVPFINITGGSFWTSKHVADVVAYLKLAYTALHGYGDQDAFKRVYNLASNYMAVPWKKSPQYGEYCNHRYLGRKFLAACRERYGEVQRVISGRDGWRFRAGAEDLISLVQEIQADLAHASNVGQVVQFILEECYVKWLAHEEGTGGAEATEDGKLDDLATVVDVASRFEEVPAFLAHVDEMVRAAQAVKDKDWHGYVVLSTVHRLKGLERPVVFGPGWAEGYQEIEGRQEPRGLLPHTFSLTPPPQTGPLPSGGKGRIEDERCIAFVLISRAKSEVWLSGCAKYRDYVFHPCRFAQELGVIGAPSQEAEGPALKADWTKWTLDDIQKFVGDNPDHPVADAWAEMLEDGIEDVEWYAEELGRVLNEYVEQAQALEHEAAEDVETPGINERAVDEERTAPPEPAVINESTDVVERAVTDETPITAEQAEHMEHTVTKEQAELTGRPVIDEQAEKTERPAEDKQTAVDERPVGDE